MKYSKHLLSAIAGLGIDNCIIKDMTGDTSFKARKLFCDNVKFDPTYTFVALFNDPPEFKQKEEGNSMIRRLVDIFFEVNFTTKEHLIGQKEQKKGSSESKMACKPKAKIYFAKLSSI